MEKDFRNEMEKSMLSPEAQQKFDELVALLAEERYGRSGPSRDTTFAEMEQFGHQAGRMLGRAIDERLRIPGTQYPREFRGHSTQLLT